MLCLIYMIFLISDKSEISLHRTLFPVPCESDLSGVDCTIVIDYSHSNWKNTMERFTSCSKSNMHRMSMEAEIRNSIKDVMIIHNKNDIGYTPI